MRDPYDSLARALAMAETPEDLVDVGAAFAGYYALHPPRVSGTRAGPRAWPPAGGARHAQPRSCPPHRGHCSAAHPG